ncbi:acyl-CoA carboxylase subunit epsilon [Lacisediminihabitans sp. G11-30]|uniref:Acyl-CoA carboxylase subunit epsilon n=1 Tax=Lacisediminihabitans changchengi TaxID=2787634 RepID=A0A934SNP2_9MICO|nr:acyl-CoA carboxylase subunit epsilon [Lacisediminihabitans changchengi]
MSGDPTPTELAAVTAVVLAMVEEAQDEEHALAAAASAHTGQSAWQRSQRPIRRPLRPGFGAWRSFST